MTVPRTVTRKDTPRLVISALNCHSCWRSVSWIIRRIKLRTKPRKGTGERYQNPPTSQAEFQLRGLLNQRQNAVRPLHLLDHRAVAVALQALRRERRSAALSIHLGIRTLRTGARTLPNLDGAA